VLQQFASFFNLIALGFLSGVRPMATPLLSHQLDLHARALAFRNRTTKRFDEGLNVCEWN